MELLFINLIIIILFFLPTLCVFKYDMVTHQINEYKYTLIWVLFSI